MDSVELRQLLEDCLRTAAAEKKYCEEEEWINYRTCRESLCAELESLLQEALDMKWPFVPEKWQYKQSISSNDKTNLNDLIRQNLHQLLIFLKSCILAEEVQTALAVAFLVDRFLYWADESSRLLKIVKLLHKRRHEASVAPQLVIRQARVYLNSGKLQKAEFILSHLISNNGATGCWEYQSESDRALVQSVCVQIRGMVLQKLGLWLEAAELIWASLVGFYSLPQPDKKGIGTSLGILANIMVSMNDKDFQAFKSIPDIDLSLLVGGDHRLLSAAEAAKMAVVYSQYASLYVLTNVTSQGTCLLSYSFSLECNPEQRRPYLTRAREAFEIGLLTKSEGEPVSSVQELHTFIKAAYSLAVTHKWLGTDAGAVEPAREACQKALALFYDYCNAQSKARDDLCHEIMKLVAQVKHLLQVQPFVNSDTGSFIPDFYRNIRDTLVNFTLESFFKMTLRLQKYHESLCKAHSKGATDVEARSCITALGTTVEAECPSEASEEASTGAKCPEDVQSTSGLSLPEMLGQLSTLGSSESLSSSWYKVNGSASPQSSGSSGSFAILRQRNADSNASIPTTESEDENAELNQQHNNMPGLQISASSPLSGSFGSHSSWEKISADTSGLSGPHSLSVSPGDSFVMLEKNSCEDPVVIKSSCHSCLNPSSEVFPPGRQYFLTQHDYLSLLSGVCHECLMKRLQSNKTMIELENGVTHNALHLKFSKASGLWAARETCVYIGQPMGKEGQQRRAIWVQFLHQEERLSSYVGKEYLKPKPIQLHLKDVEKQMTAQFYITEFNKSLYEKEAMAQIFYIPSEALLLLNDDEIVGCLTVEPFMLGDFVKLTNNKNKVNNCDATQYGLAFGHFTYHFSNHEEVVVDLQGWVTKNGEGLTYLTDPQIHSTKIIKEPGNFGDRGIKYFLEDQHGPKCNDICQLLQLPPVV